MTDHLTSSDSFSSVSDSDSDIDQERMKEILAEESLKLMQATRKKQRAKARCEAGLGASPRLAAKSDKTKDEVKHNILVEEDEAAWTAKNHAMMDDTGEWARIAKNRKRERESMVNKFRELLADYSAVPPPKKLTGIQKAGLHTKNTDRTKSFTFFFF